MPQIKQMSVHLADLIAAGEVVERPASVVKELVENAIDAGATTIVVETRGGGKNLIRVSDNGCGIAPQELSTAFLRHATSKLYTPEGLDDIRTLGFRGEALAAIAAVSRVEIVSRQTGASEGALLRLEAGVPGQVEAAGVPEGTVIQVRDLFFNTPARQKFMRKDSAETAAISGLIQHLALSHPDISFQYLKEGTESLHTPGDGKLSSAIYAAMGREFSRELLPVQGQNGNVAVSGYVSKPLCSRGSRGMQIFFVNGRFIKSQLLTAGLEEGYRNQIMKGKFPGCVLFVTMPATAVDVNVHPAKTAVKFANDHVIFDAVFHTVLNTLRRASPAAADDPAAVPARSGGFYRTMDAQTYRTELTQQSGRRPKETAVPRRPASPPIRGPVRRSTDAAWDPAQPPVELPWDSAASGVKPVLPIPLTPSKPSAPPETPRPSEPLPDPVPTQEHLPEPDRVPWRIAGEVLRTYIVCESADGTVFLVDKHAAHERIQFDRLKASTEPPMSQTLLRPIPAELSQEDAALLLEHQQELESFGFLCEDFGDGTVVVRAVPSDIEVNDTVPTLEEFAAALRSGQSREEQREAMLRTMACKAAIKGGMDSDPQELQTLVDRVQSGEIRYCPHGRPVSVRLTRRQLEKMFKR